MYRTSRSSDEMRQYESITNGRLSLLLVTTVLLVLQQTAAETRYDGYEQRLLGLQDACIKYTN